ncbi:hypothetical protein [Nonomuraea sp. NPDC050202]|jgi:hypothetical protein|uniref:hypothetical protein n=1 Tax=Nonomuraea sp. NPDC050202 TaxID=3155035 RepID=UPI0033E82B6C
MHGPDLDLRGEVASRAHELGGAGDERGFERLLDDIRSSYSEDVTREENQAQDPTELLAAVDAWASLISDACVRFYGPESPLRQSLAGWSMKIALKLRELTNLLAHVQANAAKQLGASEYGMAIGFPWPSVSVSIVWDTQPRP